MRVLLNGCFVVQGDVLLYMWMCSPLDWHGYTTGCLPLYIRDTWHPFCWMNTSQVSPLDVGANAAGSVLVPHVRNLAASC